jgi:hypothetical protein
LTNCLPRPSFFAQPTSGRATRLDVGRYKGSWYHCAATTTSLLCSSIINVALVRSIASIRTTLVLLFLLLFLLLRPASQPASHGYHDINNNKIDTVGVEDFSIFFSGVCTQDGGHASSIMPVGHCHCISKKGNSVPYTHYYTTTSRIISCSVLGRCL